MAVATIRPGLDLSYLLDGPEGAEVLVLITGAASQKEGWFRQVRHFRDRYRVLAPDNRCMGGSSVVDEPLAMRDMAEDVILLLDHLGVARAHVFGMSMGGKIAQELALGWPDRVERLVLAATSAGTASALGEPEWAALRHAPPVTVDDYLERVVPLLFGPAYRERFAFAVEAFARSRVQRPPHPVAIARQWEAHDAFDSWERLPSLRHPTLVLAGAEDAVVDPGNAARLAERIPDARAVVVPGAGHSVHIEAWRVVNQAVERFLAGESVR